MKSGSRRTLLIAAICIAVVAVVGTGLSGAYFSDTKSGAITGTVGSIQVTGSGGVGDSHLNIAFTDLLPGVPQSVTANYTNTGNTAQDVWIEFPNADALHAINDLGSYGSVSIVSNFGGTSTTLMNSTNLTDFYPDGTPGANNGPATGRVPQKMLLRANVDPSASGSFTFTFAYASKLSGTGGGVWNSYPLPTETKNGITYTPPTNVALGSLNGLPYKIVAVQVGQQP